jgi:hypothetical protein
MRFSAWWIVAAAPAALAACGGKVVIDGTGGAPGTGGSGGAAASSSSASSASSTSSSTSTTSSSSSTTTSSSGGPLCPDPFPGVFATCTDEGLSCEIPLACCSGHAVCKGGFWQWGGLTCAQPCAPDCGPDGFACEPGALCVTYIGAVTTYQCKGNPCFEDIGCGCTEMYCAEQGMTCNNIQGDYKVLCD